MNMIIRRLKENEHGVLDAIQSIAYGGSNNVRESEKNPLKSEVWGAFDDDGICMATVFTPEYKSWYFGKNVACVGIGGVATLPEYRRRGAVREIFNEIFRQAAERDWAVSYLYPFSFDYYRQFGYEMVFKKYKMVFPMKALAKFSRTTDVKLYSFKNPEMKKDILEVYNAFAKTHRTMFVRGENTRAYSDDPYASRRWTYVHYTGDTPDALATIRLEDDGLTIRELCYTSRDALCSMLGFLRAFDGQAFELRFTDLPDTRDLDAVIGEYVDVEYYSEASGMARIILLEKLLKKTAYPLEHGCFRLRCDDTLEWNRGVWDVHYGDGLIRVEKLPYDSEYDISASIQSLARLMLCGGYTAESAAYLPDVDVKNGDDFFRAFPDGRCYVLDRF